MKLGTLRDGSRDGRLVVVSCDNARYAEAGSIAWTLQDALDDWVGCQPKLQALAASLEAGEGTSFPLEGAVFEAPLPRAFEWIDGSAFLAHVRRVRRARRAEVPATLESDPLVYQGGSGHFLGPLDDIPLEDESWGLDFESEVCAILGDTPQGTRAEKAAPHVSLLLLANDISLRRLIPAELAKGFGFLQSKPATAFSPFAVTPDELGVAWDQGRVHLPLRTRYKGKQVGNVDAGSEMHFSFYDLIAHVSKTRNLTAGTILGSGTVSNSDAQQGVSCLAERRAIEEIELGNATTSFMGVGDTVEIEMFSKEGVSIFGRISQRVVKREAL